MMMGKSPLLIMIGGMAPLLIVIGGICIGQFTLRHLVLSLAVPLGLVRAWPGEDTILVVEYPNEHEEGIPSSLSGAPSGCTVSWSQ